VTPLEKSNYHRTTSIEYLDRIADIDREIEKLKRIKLELRRQQLYHEYTSGEYYNTYIRELNNVQR
jgi:hypothetical protein